VPPAPLILPPAPPTPNSPLPNPHCLFAPDSQLYQSYFGAPSTIDDIVGREAARSVRELLKLRHDPFMFHQANLAILDGSGRSLIMRWVDAVVGAFKSYVTWPIASLKLDDLQALYLARGARDACKLTYTLDVAPSGAIGSVAVSSTGGAGGCSAPLLYGPADAAAAPASLQVPLPAGGSAVAQLPGQTWAPLAA
jgi:hypothetical protein